MGTHTVQMEEFECCECGTPFSVCKLLARSKIRDDELVYCPNGHGLTYHYNGHTIEAQLEQLKKKVVGLEKHNEELKTETFRLRHEAEQLEARVRETNPDAAPRDPETVGALVVERTEHGGLRCPHCGHRYSGRHRGPAALAKHLREKHHDEATAALVEAESQG